VPRTPGNQKGHLRGKKKAMESPSDLYEPTFSSLGPTNHVNLLLDVKVVSSYLSNLYDDLSKALYPSGWGYEIISPFITRTSQALCSPHYNLCSSSILNH
jgi:hypothetical protein